MAAVVDKDTCIGCETCVGTCPVEAIEMQQEKAFVDEATCIDCGACVDACPVDAIAL